MRKIAFAAALAACFATAALAADAQPAPAPKKGMGHCCSAETTPGWGLMTPEERKAHQEKMAGFKDADSCRAYMKEHHEAMEKRAKENGVKMGKGDRHGCDHLKKKA